MENVISGSGNGSGYGDGSGNGSGYGNGYGYGDGDGDGSGDGSGYGYGYGYGYGKVDGYGSGAGNGYGYGDGSGNGDGDGAGAGDGSGNGAGNGSGYGDGEPEIYSSYGKVVLKNIRGIAPVLIDGIPTIIDSERNNYAKGRIILDDFSQKQCYVAKGSGFFAHGETLKDAKKSLENKITQQMSIEDRVAFFVDKFPTGDKIVKATDLFDWHFTLTGSCEFGRKSFCKQNGISLEKDSFTVSEFIKLVENQYGSEIILKLKEKYN